MRRKEASFSFRTVNSVACPVHPRYGTVGRHTGEAYREVYPPTNYGREAYTQGRHGRFSGASFYCSERLGRLSGASFYCSERLERLSGSLYCYSRV